MSKKARKKEMNLSRLYHLIVIGVIVVLGFFLYTYSQGDRAGQAYTFSGTCTIGNYYMADVDGDGQTELTRCTNGVLGTCNNNVCTTRKTITLTPTDNVPIDYTITPPSGSPTTLTATALTPVQNIEVGSTLTLSVPTEHPTTGDTKFFFDRWTDNVNQPQRSGMKVFTDDAFSPIFVKKHRVTITVQDSANAAAPTTSVGTVSFASGTQTTDNFYNHDTLLELTTAPIAGSGYTFQKWRKITPGTSGGSSIEDITTANLRFTIDKPHTILAIYRPPNAYVADAFLTSENAHIDAPDCTTEATIQGRSGTYVQTGVLVDCGLNKCNGHQKLCTKYATQTETPIVEIQLTNGEACPPAPYETVGTLARCLGGQPCNGNQRLCIKKATGTTKVLDISLTQLDAQVDNPSCQADFTEAGSLADCGLGTCNGNQKVCVKKDGPSVMLGSRRLIDNQQTGGDLQCAPDEVVCGARGSTQINALDQIYCCKKHNFDVFKTQPTPFIDNMNDNGDSFSLMACRINQLVCGAKNHPGDGSILDNLDCCQANIPVQSPFTPGIKELDTTGQQDVLCAEDEAVCAGRVDTIDRIDHFACCKLSKSLITPLPEISLSSLRTAPLGSDALTAATTTPMEARCHPLLGISDRLTCMVDLSITERKTYEITLGITAGWTLSEATTQFADTNYHLTDVPYHSHFSCTGGSCTIVTTPPEPGTYQLSGATLTVPQYSATTPGRLGITLKATKTGGP